MSANARSSADIALRPFAWAGFMLQIPTTFQLGKIEGTARRGKLSLMDDDQLRLQLGWTTPRARRFDPHSRLQRQLVRSLPAKLRKKADQLVKKIPCPSFDPFLGCRDDKNALDRFIGYCPATGRAVELIYYHHGPRQDQQFRSVVLPSLVDQPTTKPHQWAFFNHHFTTPPGYLYKHAVLNVGDMQVVLSAADRRWTRASLSVRFIYPATLALQRQPIQQWLVAITDADKKLRTPRYRKLFRRGGVDHEQVDTPLGPAVRCDTHLRRVLRLISWTMPWRRRLWLIHDTQCDRLIGLALDDRAQRFDTLFQTVVEGLKPPRI